MRGYSAYTDYGQLEPDWLGALPRHWSFRRLRFTASEPLMYGANEAAVLDDRALPRYIRITDVKEDGTLHDDTFRSLEEDVAAPFLLQDGDILLARSGATVGKSFQYLANWGRAAYAGYLIRFRPDQNVILPRFANYYFQTACYWACINSTLIQATIENFSAEKYKELKLPLPENTEQQQIAAFLDWKTGQIDALIARKQELLEKLKEKRLAVITQAVTKGLNPGAPMRDSGIPWLGLVPEHWEVRKAKYSCEAIIDCKNRTPEYFADGEYFVIRTTDVKDGRLNLVDTLRTDLENYKEWTLRGAPRKGDVLFTREAPAGEAALFDGENQICLGQRMMYFRVNRDDLDPEFLLSYIYSHSLRAYIESESGGSTVSHLRLGQVYNLPILQPPLVEQFAISNYLRAVTERTDRMIAKVKDAITRLTEYRTALITAATTGKIDVRGVKIPQPEQP